MGSEMCIRDRGATGGVARAGAAPHGCLGRSCCKFHTTWGRWRAAATTAAPLAPCGRPVAGHSRAPLMESGWPSQSERGGVNLRAHGRSNAEASPLGETNACVGERASLRSPRPERPDAAAGLGKVFLPSFPLGDFPGTPVYLWPRGCISPRGRSGRSGRRFEETVEGCWALAATFPAPPAASGRAPAPHTEDGAIQGEPTCMGRRSGLCRNPRPRLSTPPTEAGAGTG